MMMKSGKNRTYANPSGSAKGAPENRTVRHLAGKGTGWATGRKPRQTP